MNDGTRTRSKRITTSCASQYTTSTVVQEGFEPTSSSVSWMRSAVELLDHSREGGLRARHQLGPDSPTGPTGEVQSARTPLSEPGQGIEPCSPSYEDGLYPLDLARTERGG